LLEERREKGGVAMTKKCVVCGREIKPRKKSQDISYRKHCDECKKFKGKNEDEIKLDIKEMTKMIRVCEPFSRDWYMLVVLALTGARANELLALTAKDVSLDDQMVGRQASKRKQSKLYRRVAVGKYAKVLENLIAQAKILGRPLFEFTMRGVQDAFKRVHSQVECRQPHSIHAARHWHAKMIRESTNDILYARYRLCHTPRDATERYTSFDETLDAERWTEKVEPYLKKIGFEDAVLIQRSKRSNEMKATL
jgi:integrase